MVENGLCDINEYLHQVDPCERENTHVNGKKCIDVCASSEGILEHIAKCTLIEFNQIIETDYRGYVFDVDLAAYLKEPIGLIDDRNTMQLYLRRKCHIEKFCEKGEQLIDELKMEEMLQRIIKEGAAIEDIEYFDNEMTYMLNRATKHAQGPRRNVPASKEKIKRLATMSNWRMRLCKVKGSKIDVRIMNRRKTNIKIESNEDETENKIKLNIKNVKDDWVKFV